MSSEPSLDGVASGSESNVPRFERLPFALAPDPGFLFWTASHREAADALKRGLERQALMLLLTGGTGAGKTTLVQHLLAAIPADLTVGYLSCCGPLRGDLCDWVLLAFDAVAEEDGPAARLAALQSFMMAEHAAGRRCLLVIDEAQGATDDELDGLRQLANMNAARAVMLQILLVGQSCLRARLDGLRHAPLLTRLGADARLTPMLPTETGAYVRHRLACSGRSVGLFDETAFAVIHKVARGVPRITNLLCDLCLDLAMRSKHVRIDADLVREVVARAERTGTYASLSTKFSDARARGETSLESVAATGQKRGPTPEPRDREIPRTAEPAAANSLNQPSSRPQSEHQPLPETSPQSTQAEPAASSAPPQTDDSEIVRQLAYRAMASLPDFGNGKKRDRSSEKGPIAREEAPATKPPAPAVWRRPLHLALAFSVVVLGVGGIGHASLEYLAPKLDRHPASVSEEKPVRAAAASADIPTPPPLDTSRYLTTPALPTVAPTDITAQELHDLALDLALADRETAAVALARAASRGHSRAAYYLGQLYETGDGVPINVALARSWYAASGFPSVSRHLQSLNPRQRTEGLTMPRLLSAARTDDGMLEFVWTGEADGNDLTYRLELHAEDGSLVADERLTVSALRLAVPPGELYWSVTVEDKTAAVRSSPQRIPPAPGR